MSENKNSNEQTVPTIDSKYRRILIAAKRSKQLQKGVDQLCEEGLVQMFIDPRSSGSDQNGRAVDTAQRHFAGGW